MRKLLLGFAILSTSALAAGNHAYLKVGMDVSSRYSKIKYLGETTNNGKTKGTGYEIGAEFTQDILPNVELGLGLAYQNHAKIKADEEKNAKTYSIPVYALAKYKFDLESEFVPYVKAGIGYSFNKLKEKSYNNVEGNGDYEKVKAKWDNGLYTTIGMGVDYQDFNVELTYSVNRGKLSASYEEKDGLLEEKMKLKDSNYAYGHLTLGFGYKFNF